MFTLVAACHILHIDKINLVLRLNFVSDYRFWVSFVSKLYIEFSKLRFIHDHSKNLSL